MKGGGGQVTSCPPKSPQANQANQAGHWITDVTGEARTWPEGSFSIAIFSVTYQEKCTI
jgi:hypothetical protein